MIYGRSLSCQGADYAVIKWSDDMTSSCVFAVKKKKIFSSVADMPSTSLALPHPPTIAIPAFFIFQQIRLLSLSVKADSQWESITRYHLKSPWRPVALWCEQRCLLTHLKQAAIRRCWATLWPTARLQWPVWLRLFSIVQQVSVKSLSKEISPWLITVGVVQIQLLICDFCVVWQWYYEEE